MESLFPAVVKVISSIQSPDYRSPWQQLPVFQATGSGVVVGRRQILTAAHVIAEATFVQVQKTSNPNKRTVRVVAVSHESDLALLELDDESFTDDITPAKLAEMPELRDKVSVVGYPIGGAEISITQGVVSRIEEQQYAHSNCELLSITVDAAINSGNSGGACFQRGRLVGIAFQSLSNAENIGEIVPPPVIRHFMRSIKEGRGNERLSFPSLGACFEGLINPVLRRRFFLSRITPLQPTSIFLRERGRVEVVPVSKETVAEIGQSVVEAMKSSESALSLHDLTDFEVQAVVDALPPEEFEDDADDNQAPAAAAGDDDVFQFPEDEEQEGGDDRAEHGGTAAARSAARRRKKKRAGVPMRRSKYGSNKPRMKRKSRRSEHAGAPAAAMPSVPPSSMAAAAVGELLDELNDGDGDDYYYDDEEIDVNYDHEATGLLVHKLHFGGTLWGVLQPGDVLLSVDGVTVANNGTILLNGRLRVSLIIVLQQKHIGETADIVFARNGVTHRVNVVCKGFRSVVEPFSWDRKPTYYVYGGFSFQVLTAGYLQTYEDGGGVPLDMQPFVGHKMVTKHRREVVVIGQVLSDQVMIGYESFSDTVVDKVNGHRVRDFVHFVWLMENSGKYPSKVRDRKRLQRAAGAVDGGDDESAGSSTDESEVLAATVALSLESVDGGDAPADDADNDDASFLILQPSFGNCIALLPPEQMRPHTERIMRRYSIPADRSDDLASVDFSKPLVDAEAAAAAAAPRPRPKKVAATKVKKTKLVKRQSTSAAEPATKVTSSKKKSGSAKKKQRSK